MGSESGLRESLFLEFQGSDVTSRTLRKQSDVNIVMTQIQKEKNASIKRVTMFLDASRRRFPVYDLSGLAEFPDLVDLAVHFAAPEERTSPAPPIILVPHAVWIRLCKFEGNSNVFVVGGPDGTMS
ncbi:hypothetical protein ml_40 [Mollivirus sibericum]|uniref:hypothetical protein n=1 Tax=Mollivirus sibericum TaxID=1678078 RepID=UPI0006B2E933|nr:hypothetical protein ml_40 [Mollivirus sibericum]ALD61842.1 hypothetical protein ml_40 [Mollivirus sibericum]